jgi:integrase
LPVLSTLPDRVEAAGPQNALSPPIQELAGHADLTMTQGYMHLSQAALADAIRLLDRRNATQKFGDVVETGSRT